MHYVRNVPCRKEWWEMAKTKSVSKPRKPKQIKEKQEEKSLKRIDIGKIIALKRAGWKDKGIADEMRMEQAVVASIIYQYIKYQMGG